MIKEMIAAAGGRRALILLLTGIGILLFTLAIATTVLSLLLGGLIASVPMGLWLAKAKRPRPWWREPESCRDYIDW